MSKVITLTTDFGQGEYVAVMKGVILSINHDARLLDVTHAIMPQNILHGAYVLYSTLPYFKNAVHVGVVDPGVGTQRKGLIIECENTFLVGPDNGLLIPAARRLAMKKIYVISNQYYMLNNVSDTFHGRDVFAPVAAHLSLDVLPEEIGEPIEDFVDLKLEYHVIREDTLEGKIIHVDNFGNLITSLKKEVIEEHFEFGSILKIVIERKNDWLDKKIPYLQSYGFGKKDELLATISSSGFFEIAINSGSARDCFGADTGSRIRVHI